MKQKKKPKYSVGKSVPCEFADAGAIEKGVPLGYLSADNICRILEVSAQAGVSELKFGDLHVTFGKPAETRITGSPLGYPFVPQAPTPEPVTVLTEEEHTKISKGALEVEEVRARERQLADLLITDPSKYEELLRNGDLSDDMDGTDNDEVDE